jgi:glutathione S-transferase
MNSKHLLTGSPYPPLKDGKLRFYNMRFCPYAQRSLLVAFAKGVPLDIVNVDLKDKPEWLFDKNPGAKVPTIETAQGSLYESVLVSDYLDEVYPNRPLYPKDPFKKTLDRIWIENVTKVTGPFYKTVFAKGDQEKLKEALKDLVEGLQLFDKELKRRGTVFFAGNEAPGMLDYMLWPWMERIPVLKIALPSALDYEAQKTQNSALEKWRQAMKIDSAVQAIFISPENHHLFMKSFIENPKANYDLLAE